MTAAASQDRPTALVVFESMFGNTELVARAIAASLEEHGVPTSIMEVSQAPQEVPISVELLVVGAPTHAFSLSRASTRAEAVRQGADATRARTGLREWLAGAHQIGARTVKVAVFDTRVSKVSRLPAAAGPKAARMARSRQFLVVDKPNAFLVEDVHGPLASGELDRATAWGNALAFALQPASR